MTVLEAPRGASRHRAAPASAPKRLALSRRGLGACAGLLVGASLALSCAAPAALAASPWWGLSASARPTYLPQEAQAGKEREIVVTAENLGDADAAGSSSPVRITDTLPAGLSVNEALPAQSQVAAAITFASTREPLPCTVESPTVISCETTASIVPYGQIEVRIAVTVQETARSRALNEVSVSGGGAPEASLRTPITIVGSEPGEPTPFGVEAFGLSNEEEGGTPSTQAGTHPFQQTTTLALNQSADTTAVGQSPDAQPAAQAKDLDLNWPAGLIANLTPLPRCTSAQFLTKVDGDENACPAGAAVGVAAVTLNDPQTSDLTTFAVPLFNLEPLAGEPARLGFDVPQVSTPVYIDTALRAGQDYGLTMSASDISQATALVSARVTIWGVPSSTSHEAQRGWGCLLRAREAKPGSGELTDSPCGLTEEVSSQPLLTLASSCGEPMRSVVEGDSWAQPAPRSPVELASYTASALDGCNRLRFEPSITVAPDVLAASTPSGFTIDAHFPQELDENPTGLASSTVRDIAVTLPAGVALNPSLANGLQACSEAQIGYLGTESASPGELRFTPKLPEPLEQGVNFCPDASKIATVKIKTPLLPSALTGAAYLASPQNFAVFPQENPFGSALAVYIVAGDPASGTLVKLAGKIELGEEITATFEDLPQLPFEDLEIHFFGGERAPLATPAHCGTYEAEATFTPWSGDAQAASVSSFQITSGANGAPCPSKLPFAPTLAVGSPVVSAGSSGPLSLTVSRPGEDQEIQGVMLQLPPGLSASLAGVSPCPEAQANAGSCESKSQIGEASVSAGLGGDPVTATGRAYLTEKYGSAPFGLSVVIPAAAGPFDLGDVVVRAGIEVDPRTAQLTITTDKLPHVLEGLRLEVQHVNITINRSGFILNPTYCGPLSITGTVGSSKGATSPVSARLQAANCATQKLEPKLSISTSSQTSATLGAGLTARVEEPAGAPGTQTNLAGVRVELPSELQLRTATMQQACAASVFESDSAACPAASIVGKAILRTQLLPAQLEGPAILVAQAGEPLPRPALVLQGDGLTIELSGTMSVSKVGVTTITFTSLPDEPFESLEAILPEGPSSALAAHGSLCSSTLSAPTAFLGENDAESRASTEIAVSGCVKAAALTRAQELSKALKRCHKDRNRRKRAACERLARKRYGPAGKAAKKAGKKRHGTKNGEGAAQT